jgi:hypothetical protein
MYDVGTSLGGFTFSYRYASGTVTKVLPGLGFIIESDGYSYTIISKFSAKIFPVRHFLEYNISDCSFHQLPQETILAWLNAGYDTKPEVYAKEIQMQKLIDPMTDGLALPFKVAPFLKHDCYRNITNEHEEEIFMKTGKLIHEDGRHAPLPIDSIVLNENTKQMNAWHLARYNMNFSAPYTYTLLNCGKKLRVEQNGNKECIIPLNSVAPSRCSSLCSPANPFVLSQPPLDLSEVSAILEDITGVFVEEENPFKENVRRLSTKNIYEGIEEAHWEMKRFRNFFYEKPSLTIQQWVDAAWNEIQYRRDEENP